MYKSLFSYLSLSFFIILLLIFLIVAGTLGIIVNEDPKHQFSERLLRHIISETGTPPTPEKLRALAHRLHVSLTVTGTPANNFRWDSKPDLPEPIMLEALTTPDTAFDFLRVDVGEQVVLLRYEHYNYYISDHLNKLSTLAKIALLAGVFLLILVLYLNYRFILWLFHPIKQLKADAIKISEGDIEHRIEANRQDELGELAQSVNAMADKLRENISSKQELLLAISHELRTPLARAKMHLSLMPENEYQEKLDKNLNELNTLIEALLQSESLDDTQNTLNITVFNFALLIQQIINDYDTNRIQFKLPDTPCSIRADELRIKLLISNLINNALQYTNGLVEIELICQNDTVTCYIKDYGEGIANDEIPHLTEAFYRPDKSRQRKTGSHGLGLYLCQKIIDAHGGKLDINSKVGQGTTVKIVL